METLKEQNEQLKQSIETVLLQIEQQKELNQQHQAEIETLLKFNERLLLIIEKQLGNKRDTDSLMPISERSERDSDLISPALNSLMHSRRLAARSERGQPTANSLIGPPNMKKNINKRQSEIDDACSFNNEDLSDHHLQQKTAYPSLKSIPKAEQRSKEIESKMKVSNAVKEEMNQQISQIKNMRQESINFYDKKIGQIQGLSSKVKSYKPMDQFKNITQKLTLSEATSKLVKGAIMKGEK